MPALCATLKEKANVVCDLRMTVNDLLAQMVYEGDVKVLSDDGNSFDCRFPDGPATTTVSAASTRDPEGMASTRSRASSGGITSCWPARSRPAAVAGMRTEGQKLSLCLIDKTVVPVGRTFSAAARARFAHARNIGPPGQASAAPASASSA